MTIPAILEKMIAFSEGNKHDIAHLLKVWGYARTIGQLEGLDDHTQFIVEAAAIVHDIACPLCRRKYGQADGRHQELEGDPLARSFFADTDLAPEDIDRIAWLVGHHHTLRNVEGKDYQILLEADFLVNADEAAMSHDAICRMRDTVYRTKSGLRLLASIYGE